MKITRFIAKHRIYFVFQALAGVAGVLLGGAIAGWSWWEPTALAGLGLWILAICRFRQDPEPSGLRQMPREEIEEIGGFL